MKKGIDRKSFPYKNIAIKITDEEINNLIEIMIDYYDKNGKYYGLGKAEEFFRS